jgi:hypothetical protein
MLDEYQFCRYKLLTPKMVSLWLGYSVKELKQLRDAGGGPEFMQLGPRTIRYEYSLICKWLRWRYQLIPSIPNVPEFANWGEGGLINYD